MLFLYHFSCIDVSFYCRVHFTYSRFSKWGPSAILSLIFFAVFVKNSNYSLHLRPSAKFGEDRTIDGRVFARFRLSKWQLSAILDFHIFAIFVINSNLRLFLCRQAKFGEDQMIRCELIMYFPFLKWRPSAILYLVSRYIGPPTTCV